MKYLISKAQDVVQVVGERQQEDADKENNALNEGEMLRNGLNALHTRAHVTSQDDVIGLFPIDHSITAILLMHNLTRARHSGLFVALVRLGHVVRTSPQRDTSLYVGYL